MYYMRKIDFWCLKHKFLAFVLLTVSLTVCGGAVLYAFSAPVWLLVCYAILTLLINYVYVNFSYAKEIQKEIEKFNNCDPYPLYDIIEKILPYVKGTSEQDLILNKTSALYWMGEHEKMLEILEGLNIDKINGTLLQSKIIYYNNLACAYQNTGNADSTMAATKKVKMLFKDAPKKVREQYKEILISAEIYELKSEEKYEEALKICLDKPENNLLQRVSAAMERAELFIAINEYEKAKTQLNFVFTNGNKTYYVEKAKKMYNEIEV